VSDSVITVYAKILTKERGMTAYGFGMYGMFGQAADPFNFNNFCQRVAEAG